LAHEVHVLMDRKKTMSFESVMVHIDAEGDTGSRIDMAVALSKRHEASLIGIGGWSPGMGFSADVAIIEDEPVKHQTEELTALMTSAERRFRAAAQDIKNVEWRGAFRRPLNHLVRESRSADLVIIGKQPAPEGHCEVLDTRAAILHVGRPVLAVPTTVSSLDVRRVVVAWKDCREARRAVCDALELLQDADEITIVEVSEKTLEDRAVKGLDDVAKFLQRRGISVGNRVFLRRTSSVAAEILSLAQKEGADLLVAGAYGHSRLGEWVFGGVTRDLLNDPSICCLFAH
jgi:nucleotide-binding universal stress UspA family protein